MLLRLTLGVLISSCALGLLAEAQQSPGASASQPAVETNTLVYKPPMRGAPVGRVGGGTRGSEGPLPALAVLTPDHTGLTGQTQPTLYWYLSRTATQPIEVTIIEAQGVKPLFETRLASPQPAGVHHIRLAEHGVSLTPGVLYTWSVALIADPNSRSQDIVAGGAIELTPAPETLRAQLAQGGKAEQAKIYAAAGIWYDAMAALGELIDSAPQDKSLRQQRAALLKQVGVVDVAAYDLQQ